MRSLNRNKRLIRYALYTGETAVLDSNGYETGELAPTYGDVTELMCNISAASGEDVVQAFGSFTNYSRVICVADPACPIAEQAVVWFGVPTDGPYNYIVTRKADSKNGVLYALQEIKVNA